MADLEDDASVPPIRRSQRTRRRHSRFEEEDASVGVNNETIALDDESGQDDLPISLEDVHQESAHDPVPNQEAIPMRNQKIDRARSGVS